MQLDENAGGGDDAISTSSRSKVRVGRPAGDGRERYGLGRPGQR